VPAYSVVVPCYNEQAVLPEFHRRISTVMQAITESWEIVYVNDGSRDNTRATIEALIAADSAHTAFVNLSRNFGKEIALTAGLDHARCTTGVIVIDADLQDPPEIITDLITAAADGTDVIYAQRRAREGDTFAKRFTAHLFYRLMERIGDRVIMPPDTGDFRYMTRRVLDSLLQIRERHRFMKGLFAWVGYPAKPLLYDRAPRGGGKTSFNYWSLWNFALEGITSFTVWPLKIATYLGLLVSILAVLYGSKIVLGTLIFGSHVPGYPSLMSVMLFLGGIQLMTLGMIGEYLGRIFNETKQRPLYFVETYQPSEDRAGAGNAR